MDKYKQYHPMLGPKWGEALGPCMDTPHMGTLYRALNTMHINSIVHPSRPDDLFKAFRMTPLDEVKVVIVGQDPYNAYDTDPDVADGLAFSSGNEHVQPPSLKEILYAVEKSYGPVDITLRAGRTLEGWAEQGVLLVNQALTCPHKKAGAHLEDWKPFFFAVLDELVKQDKIVWLLWGAHAKEYGAPILNKTDGRHSVLLSEHPAAAAYKGVEDWDYGNCFNKCNEMLKFMGLEPIDWKMTYLLPF